MTAEMSRMGVIWDQRHFEGRIKEFGSLVWWLSEKSQEKCSMAYRVDGDTVSPSGESKKRVKSEKEVPERCLVSQKLHVYNWDFLESNGMISSRKFFSQA